MGSEMCIRDRVGTRRSTSYGKEACAKIVSELAEFNFVIVSGLAVGIDAAAHQAALNNNMKTIAVLGSGMARNVLYPAVNRNLAEKIVQAGGAIISEYPYMMKAAVYTFPQRNRIIAGLSQGVLVVEAPERSGALITANFAIDYNRDVFSLPGPIFSQKSIGANQLIKLGAIPITSAVDILEWFGISPKASMPNIQLSPLEEQIIAVLDEPMTRDELIRKLRTKSQEINSVLSLMEIKGIIKDSGGEIIPLT